MRYLDLFPRISAAVVGDDAVAGPLVEALRVAGHGVIRQTLAGFDTAAIADTAIDVVIVVAQPPIDQTTRVIAAIRGGTHAAVRCPIVTIGANLLDRAGDPYEAAGLTVHLDDAFVTGDLTMILREIAHDRERARQINREAVSPLIDTIRISELRATFGLDQAARFLAMADEELALRPRRIRRLLATGDHRLALREAHGLKGAISNVGANEVAKLAEKLERVRRPVERPLAIANELVAASDATRAALLAV